MINKKIIILIVLAIVLIFGIYISQYERENNLPPDDDFENNSDDNEDFSCGDSVVFDYSGETVTYGTVENPETGMCWLDRNLGASRVAISYDDEQAYGDLFQWGRVNDGHEKRGSEATTSRSKTDKPEHSKFIEGTDWRETPNDQLWQGESGTNNPCPRGWRLPTASEWRDEIKTWSSMDGRGAYNSPLKLPAGGLRYNVGAEISWADRFGEYWSSTIGLNHSSLWLQLPEFEATMVTGLRSFGISVRCIKDGEEKKESGEEEIKNALNACEGLKDYWLKRSCYKNVALINQNSSICEKIDCNEMKDECYLNIALVKKNEIVCEGIEDEEQMNNCYEGVAMADKDVSLCEGIEDDGKRNECYKNIALIKKDESICERIKENGYKFYENTYGACYENVALAKKNEYICWKINLEDSDEEEYTRSHCYMHLGMARQNLSFCHKANDKHKSNCCHYLARLEKDESVCDWIYDDNKQMYCYADMAKEKQDDSICEKIDNILWRFDCYLGAAKAKQDLSICDKKVDDLSDEEFQKILSPVFGYYAEPTKFPKARTRQELKDWCHGWVSGEQDISLAEPSEFIAPDNWVSYVNKELGFEIKVPPEVSMGSSKNKIWFLIPCDSDNPRLSSKTLYIANSEDESAFYSDCYGDAIGKEYAKVAGMSFKKCDTSLDNMSMESGVYVEEYYNEKFSLNIRIGIKYYVGEDVNREEESEIFRQILSTFRALD